MTPPVRQAVEQVRSAARGREVTLVTVRPEGPDGAGPPVVLALHSRYGNAGQFLDLELADLVAELVGAGSPPFAVAAVDGGDTYWQARDASDDPLRMLTDELPGWLAQRHLLGAAGGAPRAAFGISMGGFGAMRYARARAVAGESPWRPPPS